MLSMTDHRSADAYGRCTDNVAASPRWEIADSVRHHRSVDAVAKKNTTKA